MRLSTLLLIFPIVLAQVPKYEIDDYRPSQPKQRGLVVNDFWARPQYENSFANPMNRPEVNQRNFIYNGDGNVVGFTRRAPNGGTYMFDEKGNYEYYISPNKRR